MCSSQRIPTPQAPPPVATAQDPAILAAQEADRRRRNAMAGAKSTQLTGGLGLTTPATTSKKNLLGG